MTEKIALYGGTFDPLHLGHIQCAKHSAEQLHLSEVVLLPAHIPPHKTGTGASASDRLAMLNCFVGTEPLFSIDERELNSDQTSYTVYTLKKLKQEKPNSIIFFIIGMDSLLSFTRWHLWQEILSYCHLVVNTRPGASLTNINKETQALLAQYQTHDQAQLSSQRAGLIYINPTVDFNISSSALRTALAHQQDEKQKKLCQQWLPAPVLAYINQHQLYQKQ